MTDARTASGPPALPVPARRCAGIPCCATRHATPPEAHPPPVARAAAEPHEQTRPARGARTSLVVTGAIGRLGRLAVEALLRRGVGPQQITATGRRTEALADLAERSVTVRAASYHDRASLQEA